MSAAIEIGSDEQWKTYACRAGTPFVDKATGQLSDLTATNLRGPRAPSTLFVQDVTRLKYVSYQMLTHHHGVLKLRHKRTEQVVWSSADAIRHDCQDIIKIEQQLSPGSYEWFLHGIEGQGDVRFNLEVMTAIKRKAA